LSTLPIFGSVSAITWTTQGKVRQRNARSRRGRCKGGLGRGEKNIVPTSRPSEHGHEHTTGLSEQKQKMSKSDRRPKLPQNFVEIGQYILPSNAHVNIALTNVSCDVMSRQENQCHLHVPNVRSGCAKESLRENLLGWKSGGANRHVGAVRNVDTVRTLVIHPDTIHE
jgi:hypothetical protein